MRRLVLLALLLAAGDALATTRYVHTGCSGNAYNPTGSGGAGSCTGGTATVYPTLIAAFPAVGGSTTVAGDTLYIRAGNYGLQRIFRTNSGTNFTSGAITIAAYPSETVTFRNIQITNGESYIIYDRLIIDADDFNQPSDVDQPVYLGNTAHHIRFTDCEIKNGGFGGITSQAPSAVGFQSDFEFIRLNVHHNGDNPLLDHGFYIETGGNLFEFCEVHHNASFGIQIQPYPTTVTGNIVRNNNIHHNSMQPPYQGGGILIGSGANNTLVYNNLIYRNSDPTEALSTSNKGIQCNGNSGVKIYNNTIVQNKPSYAGIIYNDLVGNPLEIKNNILYDNGGTNILNIGGPANIILGTNLQADPSFVNAATYDFHLQAGSTAINGGSTQVTEPGLANIVTTDYENNPRPQGTNWDLGAYEVLAASGPSLTLISPSGGSYQNGSSQTVTWSKSGTFTTTFTITEDRDNNGSYESAIGSGIANTATSYGYTVAGSAPSTRKMQICEADGSPCSVSPSTYAVTTGGGGAGTTTISDNTSGAHQGNVTGTEDNELLMSNATLNQKDEPAIYVSKYDASNHNHSILKFPTVGISPSAIVTSVTLGLYNITTCEVAGSQTIDVRKLLVTDWSETQSTWNTSKSGTPWNTPGALGAGTDRVATALGQITGVGCPDAGWKTLTQSSGGLFDYVQAGITAQSPILLHLERNGSGGDLSYRGFMSSENTNATQRPYLEVALTTAISTITVTSPSTGQHYFPIQPMGIHWQTNGVSGNLNAYISYNNGTYYQPDPIVQNWLYNQPDATWTVAGPGGTQVKVKVCTTDLVTCGESAAFTIGGTVLNLR